MMFGGINAGIVKLRPDGENDAANQIGAAALTGALFKATGACPVLHVRGVTDAAGPRPMLVGSGAGAVLAAIAVGAKQLWDARN